VKPDVVEELDTREDQLKIDVGAKVGIGVGLPDKYVGDIVGTGVGLPGKYVGLRLGEIAYVTYKLVLEVLLVTVDEIAIYPLSLIDNT